ncbi:MAG: GNAT family N-acetyltransferase [Bdellovibrionota bacterium]|nr:GNAT family N-acetyltransferase [Bdellovibrionota bacterium]
MFLRLLNETDLRDILELWHKCRENDSFLSQWSDASLESYVQLGNCFALFSEKQIIAAVFFRSGIDEVEIDQFIVDPAQRRNGYGQSLLKAFCEHFSDFKILLEVAGDNYPAITLYKKCDFQEFSVRKNYYSSGQDAHCFSWCKK